MKVQDVLLKAMAKKITWWSAAEILGVCDRTMRRWRDRMEEGGYAGLADRRKGRPSAQRIPVATVEEVLRLYREEYFDLNIRHFHEKLQDQHKIDLSYTWVQKALQGAGLVAKRHKRGPHRRRRPRRPMPGMLLHIDGSKHQWLNDDRWHDLIVKSAVEKAGAWKPGKTESRFSPASTLPWKSRRNSGLPTFPPRRLRSLLLPKQRSNPTRRRPDGRIALYHKPDRSLIIKTGQLDLLPTGGPDCVSLSTSDWDNFRLHRCIKA